MLCRIETTLKLSFYSVRPGLSTTLFGGADEANVEVPRHRD